MWFTFIFTSCQGFPLPLKLFITLTTPLLSSASRNDLSLPLSLQSRLAVKAEYKTEEQFSYFKYHWKTDLSCFRGPIPCLLPTPPSFPLLLRGVLLLFYLSYFLPLFCSANHCDGLCHRHMRHCSQLSSV